jgi:hypothetical protein
MKLLDGCKYICDDRAEVLNVATVARIVELSSVPNPGSYVAPTLTVDDCLTLIRNRVGG